MPSSAKQLPATQPIEMAKVAGLALAPAAPVLLGFAWFVRSVRDPLWVLIGLFAVALIIGIATFLISVWCDRKISDDVVAQSGLLGVHENESSLARQISAADI